MRGHAWPLARNGITLNLRSTNSLVISGKDTMYLQFAVAKAISGHTRDSALPTADSHAVCLGIMISSDLKSSNQCMQACRKASKMLGMIKRTISYKKPEIGWLGYIKH